MYSVCTYVYTLSFKSSAHDVYVWYICMLIWKFSELKIVYINDLYLWIYMYVRIQLQKPCTEYLFVVYVYA